MHTTKNRHHADVANVLKEGVTSSMTSGLHQQQQQQRAMASLEYSGALALFLAPTLTAASAAALS